MSKSIKETWKHVKKDSKSVWAMTWSALNVAWLVFVTLKVQGSEKASLVIVQKIFFGFFPFVVSVVLLFLYHYLRSDLYLERNKPTLGKSLIPGRLLQLVEFWSDKPKVMLGGSPEYEAYQALMRYRASYEYDHIHPEIQEFLGAFDVSGNILVPEIKTNYSSAEEAKRNFPRLKELAKKIGKEIT